MRKNKNKKLIKEASRFKPFDFDYLLAIEKQALVLMYEYFENSNIAECDERTAKDLKLALKLLDIVRERDSAYHLGSTYKDEGWIDRHINIKNWKRFVKQEVDWDRPIFKDHLRTEKAWYLYNKLKYERLRGWWN